MAEENTSTLAENALAEHNIIRDAAKTYASVGNDTHVFLTMVRTYIAGVLMPTIAVSITASAFDQSPTARITLPADPRLFNLGNHDRLPVQIFVKETMVESPQYILMFEGYVTGRSYLSVASQREINLECISYADVFKDAKLRVMSSLEEVFATNTPGTRDLDMKVFLPDFLFPHCLFYSGLSLITEKNQGQAKLITMPTEYLANIIEFMEEACSDVSPAGRYNDSIVSRYFATLAYNLRLDRRFCWLPYFDLEVDEPERKDGTKKLKGAWEAGELVQERGKDLATMFPIMYGAQTAAVIEQLTGMAETCSRDTTLYDLLKYLIDRMEYEFLIIPNPAFQSKREGEDLGAEADKDRKTTITDEELHGAGKRGESPILYTLAGTYNQPSIDEAKERVKNISAKYDPERNCDRMVNFCLKPMFDDSFPPQCNVIFRSQVASIQASTVYNGVPTRIQVTNFTPFMSMAQLTGTSSETLARFGAIDYYPSRYYNGEDSGTPATTEERAFISDELLPVERHTGPWIHRDSAPSWMFYATNIIKSTLEIKGEEEAGTLTQRMHEQYMRRKLMRAQILEKQLQAECVFLPYITCGFPALLYDSADSGFSFAGNVIGYQHNFSPNGMSTSVTLNGVRLLAEAVQAEKDNAYPNPINSVHIITHDTERLTKVYAAILGTPGASISGATPVTWEDAQTKWSGAITDVATNPQTNIYQAYKTQRRNVITLDDYCTFMDLTPTPKGTDEDGNVPIEITNSWMNDRAEITVYEAIPLLQKILPVKDIEKNEADTLKGKILRLDYDIANIDTQLRANAAADVKKTAELQARSTTAQANLLASNTEANRKEAEAALAAQAKYAAGATEREKANEKLRQQRADRVKERDTTQKMLDDYNKKLQESEEKKKQGFNPDGSDAKVRELLKKVREEETAHNIY